MSICCDAMLTLNIRTDGQNARKISRHACIVCWYATKIANGMFNVKFMKIMNAAKTLFLLSELTFYGFVILYD